jgi:hypothetical protein
MVLIGFSDTLSLTQSIGIVGTMVLTLYFSKRQIQALSSDQETRVLNDLDEKFHNMAMLAMEDPSIARVIDTRDYANKRETAFPSIFYGCALTLVRCDREEYLMTMNGPVGYNG